MENQGIYYSQYDGKFPLINTVILKMSYTNSISNMMKYLNSINSFEQSMRAIHHFDSIKRTTEMMNSTKTFQAALASIKVNDSVQRMMKSMNFTSSIQKAISSLNYNDSLQKMMESMNHTKTIQDALSSVRVNDSVQRMMKSMDFANSIQKAVSSLNDTGSIQKMMESANYTNTLNNISKFNNLSSQMQGVGAFLVKPSILEQIIESNNSWKDLVPSQLTIEQEEFTQSIAPLSNAKNESEFLSFFLKTPPVIQAFVIFFFLQFFLPQVNNIISLVLNPYIQEIIATSNKTSKDLVKKIKHVPATSFGIDVSRLRFITGTNLRLRQKNSTNSQVIDELEIGQIVEVIRKKKNWIQVKVTYEDEVLIGWVFTRYTAKFKK